MHRDRTDFPITSSAPVSVEETRLFFPQIPTKDFEVTVSYTTALNKFFPIKEENLKEQEVVESLKKESEEFRKLLEEHHSLDGILAEIDRKVYLTPEEEIERKKMQKLKLAKKDRMAELIRDYRKNKGIN